MILQSRVEIAGFWQNEAKIANLFNGSTGHTHCRAGVLEHGRDHFGLARAVPPSPLSDGDAEALTRAGSAVALLLLRRDEEVQLD